MTMSNQLQVQPAPNSNAAEHQSVLLHSTILGVLGQLTKPKKSKKNQSTNLYNDNNQSTDSGVFSGVFVDATFGRGGHSRQLLEYLSPDATLIVFDKDPTAIAAAKQLAEQDSRVIVIHDSFAQLEYHLEQLGIHSVNGIMADLGVSSPQLDNGSRGFSFMRDGAVDMRMDTSKGISVGQWLSTVDETTLADVLYEYGEEKYSRRIAKAIKQMDSYDSTLALAETIKQAHPNWQKGKHPATQSFQAMRIFINNELGDIDNFLQQSLQALATNGYLAVISFHSLEDRRIKQFLQRHSKGSYPEDDALPFAPARPKYFYKPIRVAPTPEEIKHNPRARSAWLRIAQRSSIEWLP